MVEDRNDRFLVEYFALEKRSHRWVQLKEAEALVLDGTDIIFPKNCNYSYFINENENMREYHIDTHNKLLYFVSDDTEEFDGNLSVRLNGRRPVLLVG